MARPYSKKTVDNAETILLICAQTCFDTAARGFGLYDYADELGFRDYETSTRLAYSAWCSVRNAIAGSFADVALEAAELIRSGWMIGDPIELLTLPVETDVVENATSVTGLLDLAKEGASYAKNSIEAGREIVIHSEPAIDDGPHEPATAEEVIDAAIEQHYDGDYGADS